MLADFGNIDYSTITCGHDYCLHCHMDCLCEGKDGCTVKLPDLREVQAKPDSPVQGRKVSKEHRKLLGELLIDLKDKLSFGLLSYLNPECTTAFASSLVKNGFESLYLLLFLLRNNGPHYHNTAVLTYLGEVNEVFNINLVEYNNFEAGEGKTALYTHFAHISHKIVRYVCIGNDLETGEQLGQLVQSMKNVSCFQLSIERSKAPKKWDL
ncbi:hypothetical protein OS493_035351 [Desmophyllum pertusum]|uniref:Uncharacterized protein n=1 Tax=Desmophyllum pertusum TaxID=174260 RepID=A0A9X0CEA1_9CNID|nr:hypothetical protein OS493_035351 [Desmophyllum pertusum]